ncbi:MAG: hypothetical protein AAF211_21950 [Myxococcota bacterium]
MGVGDADWVRPDTPGFGVHRNDFREAWPRYVEDLANEALPFIG